ncbi:hypothetical protein O3P69_020264 [Scylla paramamosain]|uniref:Uncharacterized protein n=1 Tax=Scylla paramamosain TaxID=85552 RepID=A0AAW0TL97_SCYPA
MLHVCWGLEENSRASETREKDEYENEEEWENEKEEQEPSAESRSVAVSCAGDKQQRSADHTLTLVTAASHVVLAMPMRRAML